VRIGILKSRFSGGLNTIVKSVAGTASPSPVGPVISAVWITEPRRLAWRVWIRPSCLPGDGHKGSPPVRSDRRRARSAYHHRRTAFREQGVRLIVGTGRFHRQRVL